MIKHTILAGFLALSAVACSTVDGVKQDIAAFEAKAGPEIAQGCAKFHSVESDPLVGIGMMLANASTAGIIGDIKMAGDVFCSIGPPAGDVTSVVQQASWIADLAGKLGAASK